MAASGDRVPQRGPLRVALLGCGTVGCEVFRLLREQATDLAARVGAPLQVAGVAVRDPDGRARDRRGGGATWSRPTPWRW